MGRHSMIKKEKIWRKPDGGIIHVGEWPMDYEPAKSHHHDMPREILEIVGKDEGISFHFDGDKLLGILRWPKPEDLTDIEEEVMWLPDGGYVFTADVSGMRRTEYPSIADQLDYIYHNGVESWKDDMISPVKNKYPKDG